LSLPCGTPITRFGFEPIRRCNSPSLNCAATRSVSSFAFSGVCRLKVTETVVPRFSTCTMLMALSFTPPREPPYLPSVVPLRGDKIRALRRLKREQAASFQCVHLGAQRPDDAKAFGLFAVSDWGPRCRSRSVRTCSGTLGVPLASRLIGFTRGG
jgi:hypothetical protein